MQLLAGDAADGSDDMGTGDVERPVVRGAALALLPGGSEAVEDAQLVELGQASACRARSREVQPAQLLGREEAVLVAVERDTSVAIGETTGEPGELFVAEPCR